MADKQYQVTDVLTGNQYAKKLHDNGDGTYSEQVYQAGGGSAVSIADGSDAAEGTTTDAVLTAVSSTSATGISIWKTILKTLGFFADTTIATPTTNGSISSVLRGFWNSFNTWVSTPAVTPNATEVHLGEIGGNQNTVTVAQTVTSASAYASGNCVGGKITISNAARVSAGSGLLQEIAINSKSAQTTQMDVILFSADPSGSTITDKTAISIAAADFDKIIGVVHITDWTSLGTPSVGQGTNLALPFALASGTTLYAAIVTRSTPTFTATTDISVSFRFIRN